MTQSALFAHEFGQDKFITMKQAVTMYDKRWGSILFRGKWAI